MKRTHYCGAIRKEHMGQTATLCGWVQNRRDMGGVIFLDVKDREGVAQVVCNMQHLPPEDFHHAETLHMQSVIQVEGEIRHRDEETYNPRLATGEVELLAKRLAGGMRLYFGQSALSGDNAVGAALLAADEAGGDAP